MKPVFSTMLLMLLSTKTSAADQECELPERLPQSKIHEVLGVRWVLIQAFSDYPGGLELVKYANSSVVEMNMMEDNRTIACVERNVLGGSCLTFYVNMTASDPEISNHTMHLMNPGVQVNASGCSPYDNEDQFDIFMSCPHCMTLVYHVVFNQSPGRMLLIYRAEGKHEDSEVLKAAKSSHVKLAECLSFNTDDFFTYDGKTGFCEKIEERGTVCSHLHEDNKT